MSDDEFFVLELESGLGRRLTRWEAELKADLLERRADYFADKAVRAATARDVFNKKEEAATWYTMNGRMEAFTEAAENLRAGAARQRRLAERLE